MFDTMWSFLQMGQQKGNFPHLQALCFDLRQMMMQKTAGQRKNKPGDISFDDLSRIKNEIVIEAMALVLSGEIQTQQNELRWYQNKYGLTTKGQEVQDAVYCE